MVVSPTEMIQELETHQFSSWVSSKNLKIFYGKCPLMRIFLPFPVPSNTRTEPVPISREDVFFGHRLQQARSSSYQHQYVTRDVLANHNSPLPPQEPSITGNRDLSRFQCEHRLKREKPL